MTKPTEARLKSWVIWALLAGPALPEEVISMGDIQIGPFRTPSLLPQAPELSATPQGHSSFATSAAKLIITSPCSIRLQVMAFSIEQALVLAERERLDALQTSLSLRSIAEPYRVRIVGYQTEDHGHAVSSVVSACSFTDERLSVARIETFRSDFEILSSNVGLKSSQAFARGLSLMDAGVTPALRSAALLAFFQVVESVATSLPVEEPANQDRARKSLITSLSDKLGRDGARTGELVYAVRETTKELDRLDAKFLNLRIANAAALLGLDVRWRRSMEAFGKLRNQKLSHVGGASGAELSAWLTDDGSQLSARSLARMILEAYADYLKQDRVSDETAHD